MTKSANLPTDFFTRKAMHQIMLRGNALASLPMDDEAHRICCELVAWAASMDGYLSAVEGATESNQFPHLFESPTPTKSKWCATRVSLHTGKGIFFLCLEQQVMVEGQQIIPTRRYRLRLDSPEADATYALCLTDLHSFVVEYVEKFDEYLPLSSQEVIEGLFCHSDIPPVRNIMDATDM